MRKLFDCISAPLKRFLACLTFHREEIRLRHLHKRANTRSDPEFSLPPRKNHSEPVKPVVKDSNLCTKMRLIEGVTELRGNVL